MIHISRNIAQRNLASIADKEKAKSPNYYTLLEKIIHNPGSAE